MIFQKLLFISDDKEFEQQQTSNEQKKTTEKKKPATSENKQPTTLAQKQGENLLPSCVVFMVKFRGVPRIFE